MAIMSIVFAHLKRDSITVHEGFNICARSDWPVWQFRKLYRTSFTLSVMNAPDLENGQSLKIQFKDYNNPIKGEILKN